MASHPRVADLHCDLLAYLLAGELQGEERSPHDRRCLVSIPQMREGGVAFQTLAIFTMSRPDWADLGMRQAEIFAQMVETYDEDLRPVRTPGDLGVGDGRIAVMAAVENASAFALEEGPLDAAFERFDRMTGLVGPRLYVSPTWNHANRFGGGNATDEGLTDDGRVLLEFLAERRVAVDLSHTCRRMAADILDVTYAKGLDLPVLASHSPFAGVKDIPRNLADDAAQEVARRGGLLGLNLLARFLEGDAPACFVDQLAHARSLGVEDAFAFGCDFFYPGDMPTDLQSDGIHFHPGYDDASCYPRLLDAFGEGLGLDEGTVADLAHLRVERFVRSILAP
ncbi:MAG: membrane dipeptidase [Acidobacteriota bacterium]